VNAWQVAAIAAAVAKADAGGPFVAHEDMEAYLDALAVARHQSVPGRSEARARMKIIWVDDALDDLDAITAHIAQDNPTAAGRIFTRIKETASRLRRCKECGEAAPPHAPPFLSSGGSARGRRHLVGKRTPCASDERRHKGTVGHRQALPSPHSFLIFPLYVTASAERATSGARLLQCDG
jgi:plasmid stabilization system protein ParE